MNEPSPCFQLIEIPPSLERQGIDELVQELLDLPLDPEQFGFKRARALCTALHTIIPQHLEHAASAIEEFWRGLQIFQQPLKLALDYIAAHG